MENEMNPGGYPLVPTPPIKEIKVPTCGRIVHYYPFVLPFMLEFNETIGKKKPAIVINERSMHVDISVFSETGTEQKWMVPHKSIATSENGDIASHYWDWPEIKS